MSGEMDAAVAVLSATLRAGTPLVFTALGELVTEKSGVLNLGLEGIMLTGAVAGFIATVLVLVLISRDAIKIRLNAPAALGKPFNPSD